VQPFDAPNAPDIVRRLLDHLGSDELLLFSSDYPHWQFDGDDAMPPGIPADLANEIMVDNPRAIFFKRKPIDGPTAAAAPTAAAP
jgi:predicted TIM-barrel fold metal-dependent hydrolase